MRKIRTYVNRRPFRASMSLKNVPANKAAQCMPRRPRANLTPPWLVARAVASESCGDPRGGSRFFRNDLDKITAFAASLGAPLAPHDSGASRRNFARPKAARATGRAHSGRRAVHDDRRFHDRHAAGAAVDAVAPDRPGAVRPDRFVVHVRRRRCGADRVVDRRSLCAADDVHDACTPGSCWARSAAAWRRRIWTLVAARVATGAFGGILGGMAMAIIGDVFPEERRGRATGSLMTRLRAGVGRRRAVRACISGRTSAGTCRLSRWRSAGLPALVLTPFAMPPLDEHVGKSHAHPLRSLVETFSHANHLKAFALIVTLMVGSFMRVSASQRLSWSATSA